MGRTFSNQRGRFRMSKKGKKNLSGGMAGPSLEDGGSDGSDEELEQVEVKKSAFAALMDDAGDSLPSDNSDDEEEEKPKKEVVKKEAVKKEKKKKKKGDGDDEDLDAMLAALRAEYTGEPAPEEE